MCDLEPFSKIRSHIAIYTFRDVKGMVAMCVRTYVAL